VFPTFYNFAIFNDQYLICFLNRTQSVSNHEGGATAPQRAQRFVLA
jgi:hypothetical protein